MQEIDSKNSLALKIIRSAKLVIWDFDGVIKDSVSVKGSIFVDIFQDANAETRQIILDHHSRNGGLSRYRKIPLYMKWCGIPETDENIDKYLALFSSQSICKVIASPWIEGVQNYLKSHARLQKFYLVSATPADELKYIIEKLGIDDCFLGTFGSPASKKKAILMILEQEGMTPADAIFIGDSQIDCESATDCGVPFVLRGQPCNGISSTYSLDNFYE